jgi:hypothetical protein
MKKFVRKTIIPIILNLHRKFFLLHYIKMVELLVPSIFNSKKVKLGRDGDGTYILPNKFIENNGILLSFGVADDTTFEEDFNLMFPNFEIFTFDPSINELPSKNINIHFDKIGVAGKTSIKNQFFTLEEIISQKNINLKEQIVLKMDIEGWEWGVFNNFEFHKYNIPLIVIEFHMMTINSLTELLFFPFVFYNRYKILNNILKHYYIYHQHANNYQYSFFKKFTFPWLIELTLVKKSYYFNSIKKEIEEMNQINCNEMADFQYPFFKNFNT